MTVTTYDKALEQLVYALVIRGLEDDPNFLARIEAIGLGKARIDVATDVAFMDLMLTIEGKARRAGMVK